MEYEFDDDPSVISEMVYRDCVIKIVVADNEQDQVRVVSHYPLSRNYTVVVPQAIVEQAHAQHTLGPMIFGIQGVVQMLINTHLVNEN